LFSFSLSLEISTSSLGASITLYGASSSKMSIITDGFWLVLAVLEEGFEGLFSSSNRFLAFPPSSLGGKFTDTIILSPEAKTDFSVELSLKSFL